LEKNLIETRTFTPVTKESFELWFKKFNAEVNKGKEKKIEQESRTSGREFFMNAKNLTVEELGEKDVEDQVEESHDEKDNENYQKVFFDAEAFEENLDEIDFDNDAINEDI